MGIIFTDADSFSKKSTDTLKNLVLSEDIGLNFKLKELMEDRKVTSRELAQIIGVNESTISQYINAKSMATLNIHHILAICIALRITDLSELIELDISKGTESRWKKDLKLWHENGWQPVYKNKEQ